MAKIVVTQNLDLNAAEKARLDKLGEVVYYDSLPTSPQEWLERCHGAEIICSGRPGLESEKLYELQDIFISIPFVGVGFLNIDKLRSRKILVARSPGGNKEAVSEWITAMLISLFRNLPLYIDAATLPSSSERPHNLSLKGKRVAILGKGNIGERSGRICEAMEAEVNYFDRDDDLEAVVVGADAVILTLPLTDETNNLLDERFFELLKKGAYFISISQSEIYNADALIKALDKGHLAGAAIDCGSSPIGDTNDPFFRRLAAHPKIMATPHIAYDSDVSDRQTNGIMIDNVEAYLKGKPINLIY